MSESKRELLFQARKADFRIDVFRAGGKGGQHQNKTSSGVRITHIPSGLSVESRSERSQHANRRFAFRRLASLLVLRYTTPVDRPRFGSTTVIRTYNVSKDRIYDHQTGAQYSYRATMGRGKMTRVIEERAQTLAAREFADVRG